MPYTAYIDDNISLGRCFLTRNSDPLAEQIRKDRDSLTWSVMADGEVFGYRIARNNPVSELYGMEVRVVRFVFSHVDTLHQQAQEDIMLQLMNSLSRQMDEEPAYYNIRLPFHIIDLTRAFNKTMKKPMYFCGGTTEQIHVGEVVPIKTHPDMKLFWATPDYIAKNKDPLLKIMYDSFELYQGQYHISPVTSARAGEIYRNWVYQAYTNYEPETVIAAEFDGRPVGQCLLRKNETGVDGLLCSIDTSVRKLGIYRAILDYMIRYAVDTGRFFVASTQLDNFISAGTMNSLNMRPLYGVYNFHYDTRKEGR